ncbi:hypothetical protein RP20_CCG019444 [Aedes albopictus]|nr:hypothetical protein RP20_CCG019444 [Aedes albopictus]
MTLVRRSEYRAKYVCDPLYVFPDTAEPSRELVCTAKHTWNRPLPACVEKRATEGSGLVSHYEQKRKISDSDESMSDKKADTVYVTHAFEMEKKANERTNGTAGLTQHRPTHGTDPTRDDRLENNPHGKTLEKEWICSHLGRDSPED